MNPRLCANCRRVRTRRGLCGVCRQTEGKHAAAHVLPHAGTSSAINSESTEGEAFMAEHAKREAAHAARVAADLDRIEPGWRERQAALRNGREAKRR